MGTEPPTAAPEQGGAHVRSPDAAGDDNAGIGDTSGSGSEPPIPSGGPHGEVPNEVTTPSDALQAGSKDHEGASSQGDNATGVHGTTDRPTTSAPPRTEETWGDKVRANLPKLQPPPTANQIRGARMLQGVWNPLHVTQLTATLTADWTTPTERTWTEEQRAMRGLALASANANQDDSIRQWTEQENQTLVSYMSGDLDLPHPPNFLKEIFVAEHRAMVEDFHERYLNVTLTANLPPSVRLAKHVPHAVLFKELFQANTDGRFGADMMRVLQGDAKRIVYDGFHTLHVVFYSRHAADRWVHKTLRLQRAVITLHDTARRPGEAGAGTFTAAQLDLQYAVRVFGAGSFSLVALTRAFKRFAGAKVLDVEYARASKTEIYDNRYHTVRFSQATCPMELQDVTRVEMDGTPLTIHHFQTQLRRPCSRCYSPRHGGRKCTVADDKLGKQRELYSRSFTGSVENVQPSGRLDYSVSSAAQLVELLTSMQQDDAMQAEPLLLQRITPAQQEHTAEAGQQVETTAPAEDFLSGASPAVDASTTESQPTSDAAGYSVHRSKGAKKAAKREQASARTKGANVTPAKAKPGRKHGNAATQAHVANKEHALSTDPVHADQTAAAEPEQHNNATDRGRASGKRKPKHGKTRFEEFQRAEAKGYYGAFIDASDSEGDDDVAANMSVDGDDSGDVPDPDPQSEPTDNTDNGDGSPAGSVVNGGIAAHSPPNAKQTGVRKTTDSKRAGQPAVNLNIKQQSMGVMTDKAEKLSISATATKSTRQQQIAANRTGLRALHHLTETKGGLVQTSMARYMNANGEDQGEATTTGSPKRSNNGGTTVQSVSGDEVVPATPDSQEEFTMGDTHQGTGHGDTDQPIQIGQWLRSFNGHEVNVEANGHCAFLALYASTKNHPHETLANSAATVKHATKMKSTIYACMMANLRHDVALGLVDPIAECKKIYPHQSPHSSAETATAGLFAHYAQARDRPVDKWQPVEYWAGTHELRAMAQFLREPLLVIDATASTDAHIQRYLYKDYRLPDGADHESGYVEALTDRDAAEYLRSCFALHVMPTFLVLRRQESHFHGVGHGALWVKWQAEGDPDYTADLPNAYEWKEDINRLTHEEASVDLTQLNLLEDLDELNALIVKRVNPRARLDLVHARRGLPTLDRHLLIDELEDLLRTEEGLIHAAYGADGYAAALSQSDGEDVQGDSPPTRYTRSASGTAVAAAYRRLLGTPGDAALDGTDLPLLELMQAENREAFGVWCNLYRTHLGIPPTRKRRAQVDELHHWLLGHYVAMRHLFAFLPYPELEAKRWPIQKLLEWGAAEASCEQLRALIRVINDRTQPLAAREFCIEWHEACMAPDMPKDTAQKLAQCPDRWTRLRQWLPAAFGRPRPQDIPVTEWRLMHIMPYVVEGWAQTPMGRAPHEARDLWFRKFDTVRGLIAQIVDAADWSGSTVWMQSGLGAAVKETSDGDVSAAPPRN